MATKRRRGATDGAEPVARQRFNVRLHPESYERLMIHCLKAGKRPGRFLDDLIGDHCKDWKVQVNHPALSKGSDRLDGAGDVSRAAMSVA